jgi:hypothetical protein
LLALAAVGGVLVAKGVKTFYEFRPAAITLGPNTTLYFSEHPSLVTRVHEAIHRRQMSDKSALGRIVSAVRYNFDYSYRLDEEAEAKAGEICLQIHKFSAELPAYTTARSRSQAEVYRAWAWENIGPTVPDRVGEKLGYGERCQEILSGVSLDLPPGEALSDDDALKLAAFRFLQAYGSSEAHVAKWKARLELAGWAKPQDWDPDQPPPFWLVQVARSLTPSPDTAIDATSAGQALHRLTYYKARRMYSQLQPIEADYRQKPLLQAGEDEQQVGIRMSRWPSTLLVRALYGGLLDREAHWLAAFAEHPLHRDFETFARAAEADIVGTRYQLPVAGGWERLVPTELGPVREAFQAQWGRAALAVYYGDQEGAEAILTTVVAGALQMVRNAPFEVDVMESLFILDQALRSLADLEEAWQGTRPTWAKRLESGPPAIWTRGYRASLFAEDPAAVYRALPLIAGDRDIPHAFKRFAYRQVALFDVCLSQVRDRAWEREHSTWRTAVESGLVRRESDAQVLAMMRGGVEELLVASDVTPDAICAPSVVVRPQARYAIMASPLRSSFSPAIMAGEMHQ